MPASKVKRVSDGACASAMAAAWALLPRSRSALAPRVGRPARAPAPRLGGRRLQAARAAALPAPAPVLRLAAAGDPSPTRTSAVAPPASPRLAAPDSRIEGGGTPAPPAALGGRRARAAFVCPAGFVGLTRDRDRGGAVLPCPPGPRPRPSGRGRPRRKSTAFKTVGPRPGRLLVVDRQPPARRDPRRRSPPPPVTSPRPGPWAPGIVLVVVRGRPHHLGRGRRP